MQPATPADDGPVRLVEAPDLDGDGTRELVVASSFFGRELRHAGGPAPSEPQCVYVDALSGKDGHPLWSWHADIAQDRFARIWEPRWWGRGT